MEKVTLKPLEEQGFEGYGISTDGRVWSLLDTHGQITKQWSERVTYPKRGVRYVKLHQVGGKTCEVRVAKLLLVAAFGPLPGLTGYEIRYESGDKSDCRLANLSYGPSKGGYHAFRGRSLGATPPGFLEVEVEV
jgi:hypothetical protein